MSIGEALNRNSLRSHEILKSQPVKCLCWAECVEEQKPFKLFNHNPNTAKTKSGPPKTFSQSLFYVKMFVRKLASLARVALAYREGGLGTKRMSYSPNSCQKMGSGF